ncbi:type III-A CRISPR-associated RAMP protein Csm3 [Desulfatibacillum aliphaticivorans]|uniref:type III-A CRISPR-associated RAMP protein Csm3 n=1 Tax=Desulfatibacillum aliphaticivorans TaxID=218208 RepID=UPI00041BCE60|nr:type III-A CRISPR-associated RAMP protein Csm3 [Desulfatibacillum aliphaticivorans]
MKLEKIIKISGKIKVITGLHIGAASETIEIGGMDNPIIKDPLPESGAPYIPGSSLKGKLRSLLEIKEGRYVMGKGRADGAPCDCGQKDCPVCPVFGTSASKDKGRNGNDVQGPTRVVVRDAMLSSDWKKRFEDGDLPMEVKYENSINRISCMANPRPLERVPAGVEFDFNISFKKFDEDPDDYFQNLLKAMKMLELDALGGAGSRGCGQIKFCPLLIDGVEQSEDFLESLSL